MSRLDDLIEEIELISKPGSRFKPHKYLTLMAVLQLIREKKIKENSIYFDSYFKEKFKELFKVFGEELDSNRPHTPFFHLSSSSFWKLIPFAGKEKILMSTQTIGSAGELNNIVLKAKIDPEVFGFFMDMETNLLIEKKLIECLEKGMIAKKQEELIKSEDEQYNLLKKNMKNDCHAFKGNPFVNYLNLLHNRDANSQNLAESLVTNTFASMIQIPHPLTIQIEQVFKDENKKHVILTGHAGDGKTTIAVELFKRIKGIELEEPLTDNLKRREDLSFNNKEIAIIKDLSEWSEGKRVTLIDEAMNNDRKFLLISNSGTLIDSFCAYEEKKYSQQNITRIEDDILTRLNSNTPKKWIYEKNIFIVINLSMISNLEIAKEIFSRMIDRKYWEICKESGCHEICPIYRNLKLIWDNKEIVMDRIFLVYRKMYEYGNRFTLRQLTAHVAYMITSGLNYEDIQKFLQNAYEYSMTEFMFFNRFFGDNGVKIDQSALQLKLVREIRKENFGIKLCPVWERKLWSQREGEIFFPKIKGLDEGFLQVQAKGLQTSNQDSYKFRGQIRRILFFLNNFLSEEKERYLKTYLNSPMILKLISWQNQDSNEFSFLEEEEFKKSIFHVLQEYFAGIRLPEGISYSDKLYITLNRGTEGIRQSSQVVLTCFERKNFIVQLETENDGLGGFRKNLIFKLEKGNQKIIFDLPMLDYVVMRNIGLISQKLKSSYVDRLENFKGKLLINKKMSDDSVHIIRLQVNYKIQQQEFRIRDNKLEVR